MDGDVFRTYVEHALVPELAPEDIVVMDNPPAHRVSGVRTCIERAGASLVYLPPYSPDLNPIEMAFAKLKAFLRAVAPRTITDLWRAIPDAINRFTPDECRAHFTAAGYEPGCSETALADRSDGHLNSAARLRQTRRRSLRRAAPNSFPPPPWTLTCR
jgi:transposase